jgi:hypothetical protein
MPKDKPPPGLPRFKVGDVVVTVATVATYSLTTGKREGGALPGWKWRVVEVVHEVGRGVRYLCVSHDEPRSYRSMLRDKQIHGKVGAHVEEEAPARAPAPDEFPY